MIPLPVILAELIMAVGGALLAANAFALYRARTSRRPPEGEGGNALEGRPRSPRPEPPQRRATSGRVVVNMLIGLVVFTWGLATFLVRTRG